MYWKKSIQKSADVGLVLLHISTVIDADGGSSDCNSRCSLLGPKNCREHFAPISKLKFKLVSARNSTINLSAAEGTEKSPSWSDSVSGTMGG